MHIPNGLRRAIARRQEAVQEFLKGNVLPWKQQCSQRDDVTIVGGWGGFEKGWDAEVEQRYDWAGGRFKDAKGSVEFESISLVVTPELAYSVDIERSRVRLAGEDVFAPMVLRVTTIFRLEDGDWKMTHRHADPLIGIQTPASVTQT